VECQSRLALFFMARFNAFGRELVMAKAGFEHGHPHRHSPGEQQCPHPLDAD
jgi:hypothetical protein